MRPLLLSALIAALALLLAGCTLRAGKQAATPPPPKPAAIEPPQPEQPLSVPQTVVVLPSRQEFNPDAIPKVRPAVQETPATEKAETPSAPRVTRRAASTPAAPKPDATEPEAADQPAAQAPAPAPEQSQPFQPIMSADEQNRIKSSIEDRRRQINDKLSHNKSHLSKHNQTLVDRIHSFLTQCDQAAERGDYTQADALSERALVLAQELQGE